MEDWMKKEGQRPSQERLKELFHYDLDTGIFTRRKVSNRGPKAERKYGRQGAGRVTELGYVVVMVDGINYISGSLAWCYVHGSWPMDRIKYIDGNKLNNRISNIRLQDKSQEDVKSQDMTQARLKELLHYEPDTGWFTWRIHSSMAKPGERAGGGHGLGYRSIGLDYKKYLEHTLAVLYMTGAWPTHEVDHINRDKSDNRWCNLREATRSQNGHNKGLSRRSSTGFPGVSAHGSKYKARMFVSSKELDFGWYVTIAQARIARLLAEKQHLGHFTTWEDERDGQLPMGDGFLGVIMRENRLYVLSSDGQPIEVTDVNDIQVLPVNDEGAVIQ